VNIREQLLLPATFAVLLGLLMIVMGAGYLA
jgi:hypothetical protein